MYETNEYKKGWRTVRIRSSLAEEIDKLITHYSEFGVSKWNNQTHFVQEAVVDRKSTRLNSSH